MAYNPGYVDGNLVATNAAYTMGVGLWKIIDPVGSSPAYWVYVTTDSLAATQVSGYISDAGQKRLKLGDIVDVFSVTLTAQTPGNTGGAKLGAATFPSALGILSLFSAQPSYQRMIVSAFTAGTTAGTGTATLTAIEPNISNIYDTPRNVLDGGDASINPWQRGTSFNPLTATSANYTADRWFIFQSVSATSATMVKTANSSPSAAQWVAGFTQSFLWGRAQSSGSVSTITLGQVLESNDSFRLAGQQVTLSFFAAANTGFAGGVTSSNITVSIIQGFGTDQSANSAVAGTWTSQSTVVSSLMAITTTATRYAVAGTVSNTATQIGVLFQYTPTSTTATTAESIFMNGMQLEVGGMSVFEHREIEQELAFCQRYFFQVNEPGTSGTLLGPLSFQQANSAIALITLPVQMRVAPTVTVTQGSFGAFVGGAYVALTSMAAGSTHSVNYVSVNGLATAASGFAAFLVSSSATTGKIAISADL